MNFQETVALVEVLKASGVTKFKSHEHEIEFGAVTTALVKKPEATVDASKEVEAKEKLKNLINTVNMSPEELANKMFPDGAL